MKLFNTLFKLEVRKSLRAAYFGGSITEGGNDYGWRAKTTAWLREKWPDARITEIMASVGGTGSELGAYRCDHDLTALRPDLVFIEYAVNDYGTPADRIARNIEAIVRKILKADPMTDIVFVYTTTKTIEEDIALGKPYTSRETDEQIAFHYNCPSVDIGTPLARTIAGNGNDWMKYTLDTTHPNREGYAVCGQACIRAMSGWLEAPVPAALSAHPMPVPISDNIPEAARIIDASYLCRDTAQPDTRVLTDWKKLYLTLAGRWNHTIGANKPGSELIIPFSGTAVGLYYMVASDSGIFEYKVDNAGWNSCNTFSHYALSFAHATFILLAQNLPDTEHTLRLRVCEKHDDLSAGSWIRIGAIALC